MINLSFGTPFQIWTLNVHGFLFLVTCNFFCKIRQRLIVFLKIQEMICLDKLSRVQTENLIEKLENFMGDKKLRKRQVLRAF